MHASLLRTGVSPHKPSLCTYPRTPLLDRQRGAFAVMTAVLIVVLLAFCGLAMETSRLYNRKAELQTAADAIALAAAAKLNGTTEGIADARTAAEDAATTTQYAYTMSNVEWDEVALSFAASPDSDTWLSADAAALEANASKMFFVRVDTSRLEASHGSVMTLFFRIFPNGPTETNVGSVATAGRSSINVTPLAICAMSETRADARGTELVEFGFRRGVSYNLMKLNPTGTAAGLHFLVNPVALPGTTGASVMARMDVVEPFVCTGTLGVPTLESGRITVEPGFPLDSLSEELNSRFGSTAGSCQSSTAPPDSNIKQFTYSTAFPWMNSPPTEQSAVSQQHDGKLMTIADMPQTAIPVSTNAGAYGPLWVYAKPVIKDSRYVEGRPEPSNGYNRFTSDNWPTLYTPGAQRVKTGRSYPSTPYSSQIESPPGGGGLINRRVLNIPLLRCPVSTTTPATAEVAGIGRFFMTVSATGTDLHAEFAGLAHQTQLSGKVELYP